MFSGRGRLSDPTPVYASAASPKRPFISFHEFDLTSRSRELHTPIFSNWTGGFPVLKCRNSSPRPRQWYSPYGLIARGIAFMLAQASPLLRLPVVADADPGAL